MLQTTLEAVPGMEIAYSLRSGPRVIERLSTGDIDVIFLMVSSLEDPDSEFLQELASTVCSGVMVVPVCSLSKAQCLQRLLAANIRTSHYYLMPRDASEQRKLQEEIERSLARAQNRERLLASSSSAIGVQLVAVVTSTGGPEALAELLSGFGPTFEVPIVVTQHMPEGFIDPLCTNLARQSGRSVERATEGAIIQAGTVYVAPGDAHLCVRKRNGALVCSLDNGPPSAGCKPSGNVMLKSAAKATGGALIAVTLTGMGEDGAEGMDEVHKFGGRILVQDEASSVVWGMPGAVVRRGLTHSVVPLSQLAPKIVQLVNLKGKNDVRCAG